MRRPATQGQASNAEQFGFDPELIIRRLSHPKNTYTYFLCNIIIKWIINWTFKYKIRKGFILTKNVLLIDYGLDF